MRRILHSLSAEDMAAVVEVAVSMAVVVEAFMEAVAEAFMEAVAEGTSQEVVGTFLEVACAAEDRRGAPP